MKYFSSSKGFSLIEILISLAIFAMVVTAGAAAILSSISANQKAQSLNSVITNVNLALEAMAREIRLGSNYVASVGNTSLSFTLDEPDKDGCVNRRYYLSGGRIIVERSGGTTSCTSTITEPFTASEVTMSIMEFKVCATDTCAVGGLDRQPFVQIRVAGTIQGRGGTGSDFTLQTVVSKRLLEDGEI